jgi:addiction module RelE/StbE family toxin
VKYEVLIFPSAEADLNEIKEYFKTVLAISADTLIDKFIYAIELLEENPFIHPIVRDKHLAEKGYRFIPIDNYLVFYVINNTTVQIHRFLYGKRLYTKIL